MQGCGPYHELAMESEHIKSAFAVAEQTPLYVYHAPSDAQRVRVTPTKRATGTISSSVERPTIASCIVKASDKKHLTTTISHIEVLLTNSYRVY